MQIRKTLPYLPVIGVILVIVVPILAASLYAIPSADDYANAVHIRDLARNSSHTFEAVAKGLWEGYSQKGYPLITFFHFVFSPFWHFGLTGLRIAIFVINLSFVAALYFFVRNIMIYVFRDRNMLHILILYAMLAFCFLGMRFHPEPFLWMTGSFGYLLPVSGLLAGLAFFSCACRAGKRKDWVLSALFGALGAMGPTQISAMACGLYAMALVLLWINQKPARPAFLSFAVVLFFGIVGLCAPGIYVRHSYSGAHSLYSPLRLLGESFLFVFAEARWLLTSPFSLVIALSAFLADRWFVFEKPIPKASLILTALMLLLAPGVVMFPFFYGYGIQATALIASSRQFFVAHLILMLSFLSFTLCLVAYCKSRKPSLKERAHGKSVPLAMALVLLSAFSLLSYPLQAYPPLKLTDDLLDGEISRTERYWRGVLEEWSRQSGQEVVVNLRSQQPYLLDYYSYPIVSWDREWWENTFIADYYGLTSIQGVYD